MTTQTAKPIDLSGSFTTNLHDLVSAAAAEGPIATDESTGATVLLRQNDIEILMHDQRLAGIGLTLFDAMGISEGPLRDWYGALMFTTEGNYHRRIRSLVSRTFTPRSVETLRVTAKDLASTAADSVRDGGDLVEAFSALATRLICRLLGVPDADVEVFRQWADALSPVFFVMTPEQVADATQAIGELRAYVEGLTTRRAEDPGSDLVTALLAAEADGDRLTHPETVNMIANLLVAGHDTAGSQIPCSFLVALRHQEQLSGVAADDVRLASASAETMRLEPSIAVIPRTATAPIDLHGTAIPSGAMVFLCLAAACRDETAWPEPLRFVPDRFTRSDTAKLLNFGAGTHYCLGTALAKIAVEESLRAVLAVAPQLRLIEDPEDIPWRQVLGRSPARLLVRPA